jgi:hypothetical protein
VPACANIAPSVSRWILRAIELRAEHRMSECLDCLHRALTLDPHSAHARYELARAQLLTGNYAAGFPAYQSRWEAAGLRRPVNTDKALLGDEWRGQDLTGKRLLLHAEQGFGDTIQFIRYAPLVARLDAQVFIEVQSELRDLAACMTLDCTLGNGVPSGRYDFHCSLIDLPAAFRTAVDTIPPPVTINIPEQVKHLWRTRIPPTRIMKVGLVWAGSPGNSNDAARSMKLDLLSPVLDSPLNAEFFSFQWGPPAEQLTAWEERVTDLRPHLHTFVDTAAALLRMDRVITVDTAVAHLAGSLGLEVWLLLPYTPCWRWLLDTRQSPWYPTMQLFRQASAGAWESVVRQLPAP